MFFLVFLCRKTWKPPNMCAGCVWPDSSFIRLTRVACKFFFGFNMSSRVPVSLFFVVSCVCLLVGVISTSHSSPLSSERSVTSCLLRAPRSPFSLYLFLVFQCSLVPLCLPIRGEQYCQQLAAAEIAIISAILIVQPDCAAAHRPFVSEMGLWLV